MIAKFARLARGLPRSFARTVKRKPQLKASSESLQATLAVPAAQSSEAA